MTKYVIIALLTISPVLAQTPQPSAKLPLTDREQIQADRAKAAAEEEREPTARPWDRNADGKRPWDQPVKPIDRQAKP